MANSSSTSSAPRIMVFRPTMEEFKDFSKYIEYIESQGAHKAGLAKIIPPEGWCPRKGGYDDIDLMIPAPISQFVNGRQGLYHQYNVQQKAMHVLEFKKLAESGKYRTPNHFDYEDIERKYWKNITFNAPIYGADVSGSLYDDGVDEFNIQRLNTILDLVKNDYEIQIEGVNTAYLYFGMWKTTFAWHTEDMDLYSINYLHFGAPKSWYVVPPEHGRRLERLAAGFFHSSHTICPAFLRHKMTIIAPHILRKYSIPFSKITQEPGEFMITFPFAYHAGFNHGFNCAESTNFALPRWVEYGKRAAQCVCRNDCVKICMDIFVRKFQPEKYDLWKSGKDYGYHPEDPAKYYVAPAPNKLELALSHRRQEEKKKPKQRRQPLSKVRKSSESKCSAGTDEECEKSEEEYKPPKKKKSRRNPPTSDAHMLMNEESLKIAGLCDGKEGDIEDSLKIEGLCDGKEGDIEESMKVVGLCDGKEGNVEESMKIEGLCDGKEGNAEESIKNVGLCDGKEDNIEESQKTVGLCDGKESDIKKEGIENPPELMPFWHPESKKMKKEEELKHESLEIDEETVITSNTYYQSEAEILDKFPQLKNAIDHGALSVKLLDEESEANRKQLPEENIPEDVIEVESENKSKFCYSDIFAQNWRCEQVENGIKIKLVSPKNRLNTVSPNLTKMSLTECSVTYVPDNGPENSSAEYSPSKSKLEKSMSTDSEKESSPKVKRAASSKNNWAHHLNGLWHHENPDFESECNYNQKLASIPPHCAVCVIFTPMLNKDSFLSDSKTNVPSSSIVKMPAFCYDNSLNECIMEANSLINSDGTSHLLTCSVCKVCVHAPCYGVSVLPSEPWLCSRCSVKAENAQCCLCVLRGGALKPTTDGRWAHVICTILITETFFENTVTKEPIDVSKITQNRLRLKCKYCNKAHAHKDQRGVCVQCQSGKCYLPFHVTCGFMAGVIFESNDWPEPINMICTKHVSARKKSVVRQFTNVSVGESVVAKHKNRRYYWASVKNKYVQVYYSILFDDNSHSTNTLPEDIVSKDVAVEGPPEINEKVKVKWTDGKIYNGIFKGSQSVDMFEVEFDDGTLQHQERKQIFAADEELPKEVQSRMSHSSVGKRLLISDVGGKRMRYINQKYFSA